MMPFWTRTRCAFELQMIIGKYSLHVKSNLISLNFFHTHAISCYCGMWLIFELTNFLCFGFPLPGAVPKFNGRNERSRTWLKLADTANILTSPVTILSHPFAPIQKSLLFLHTVFPKWKSGTIKLPLCSLYLLALYHLLGFLQKGCRKCVVSMC